MLARLALCSLVSRRATVAMTVAAIALSVALFLGVEKLRTSARDSFADTISGTDLIVGARTGSVQLLLYAVFGIGEATNNMSWRSYQGISRRREVDWMVPISLGDSHKGYRVIGTTPEFFDRYRYREGRTLRFTEGVRFNDLFDAVVGADVAEALGYKPGDKIVVSHGLASFTDHDDLPFQVSGVLAKSGTPMDRAVLIGLDGLEAIHVDWKSGARIPGMSTPAERLRETELQPKAVTAALVGVKSKLQIFRLQRAINTMRSEPLMAALPGVALSELWRIVGVAEQALLVVSSLVIATALVGMIATMFASLNERRREMAIFRAIGARPHVIFMLLGLEAAFTAAAGAFLGLALLYFGLLIGQPLIDAAYGLYLPIGGLTDRDLTSLLAVVIAGAFASLAPGIRAYRASLADGLTVRN